MIDDAAREIVSDPEKFKNFLDTQSRMDRYSAANALLIYSQYPQATQLKDFDDWGKDNVKITKGAKSISILEPVEYTRADGSPGISYNVKKVFDVTQTNGRKAPAVSANRDPKALITTMLDVSPVEVAATDELPYPNMAAFYNNEKQTLYVKRNVGDSVAVAQCVAQELGHAQLSINSESYSRRDMGFQAVCIGYMICKKYGVDTQNFAINRIPEDWLPKSRKKSVRSFPRHEMQWQKFTVISLMKCSARSRSVQRTMRDNGGQIWKKKNSTTLLWTIMNTVLSFAP